MISAWYIIRNATIKSLLRYLLFLALVLAAWLFISFEFFPGHGALQSWLIENLVSVKPLPCDFTKVHTHLKTIIYVLGGSQESLKYRFKAASELYGKYTICRIAILDRPGITEYDPLLKRNLTNNEWSIEKLEGFSVKKKDIEFITLPSGYFGTLTEAWGVSQEVTNKGYDVLILVSSPYHTMRIRESFSRFLSNKGIDMYIYASEDQTNLIGLLEEYSKLMFYKSILLQIYGRLL